MQKYVASRSNEVECEIKGEINGDNVKLISRD